MKTILIGLLFTIYSILSVTILSICIVLPLACENFPLWFTILILILGIIIGFTQKSCLNYFRKELDF